MLASFTSSWPGAGLDADQAAELFALLDTRKDGKVSMIR